MGGSSTQKKKSGLRKLGEYDNLTGLKFNRFTVLELDHRDKHRNYYWKCKCDCGNIRIVEASHLKSGHSKSCGCISKENTIGDRTRTHGECKTRLYRTYRNMINRCYYSKRESWKEYYQDRGITVCDEWLGKGGYERFRDWSLANGFIENIDGHKCSLDRIDNDKGYSPYNCRWVDSFVQSNNRRGLFIVYYKGVSYPIKEVCKITGLCDGAVRDRRKRGYTDEEIFEIPKGGKAVADRLQKTLCN